LFKNDVFSYTVLVPLNLQFIINGIDWLFLTICTCGIEVYFQPIKKCGAESMNFIYTYDNNYLISDKTIGT